MLSENVLLPFCNYWPQYVGRGPGWLAQGEGSILPPLWFGCRGTLHTEDRAAMCVYPLSWAVLLPFWGFHPMICNFVPWKFPLPFGFGEAAHLQPLCFFTALPCSAVGPWRVGPTRGRTSQPGLAPSPSEVPDGRGWGYPHPPCSSPGQQDRPGPRGPAQPARHHDGPQLPVLEAAAGRRCALAALEVTWLAPGLW